MKNNKLTEANREILLCMNDPLYFINTYVKIKHTSGPVDRELTPFQEQMIKNFNDVPNNIAVCGSQLGCDRTIADFVLWYSMYHMDKTILITSPTDAMAKEMMELIRYSYDNMEASKPEADENNKHCLRLNNGCCVIATSITPNTGRGMMASLLVMHHFGVVKENLAVEWFTMIQPIIECGSRVIMTANPSYRCNSVFTNLWEGANKGLNSYRPYAVYIKDAITKDEVTSTAI